MPLTNRTSLALASLVAIAHHGHDGRAIGSNLLEQRYQLPRRTLEPVLQLLVRHGFLRSVRGARGGYVVEEPERVTLGRVIKTLEPNLVGSQPLQLFQSPLEDVLGSAYEAMITHLNRVTLADATRRVAAAGISKDMEPILDFTI